MKVTMIVLMFTFLNHTFAGDVERKFVKGEFLKKELNLTDEQLEKVREIRKSRKENLSVGWKDFKKAKSEFRDAMKNPKISNEELKSKFEKFQNTRDEFHRKRFEIILQMREILKPEQLEKFLELKKKRKGKWKKNQTGKKNK